MSKDAAVMDVRWDIKYSGLQRAHRNPTLLELQRKIDRVNQAITHYNELARYGYSSGRIAAAREAISDEEESLKILVGGIAACPDAPSIGARVARYRESDGTRIDPPLAAG